MVKIHCLLVLYLHLMYLLDSNFDCLDVVLILILYLQVHHLFLQVILLLFSFLIRNMLHIDLIHLYLFYPQFHKRNNYMIFELLVIHLAIHALYDNPCNTNNFLANLDICYIHLYHLFLYLNLLLLFINQLLLLPF